MPTYRSLFTFATSVIFLVTVFGLAQHLVACQVQEEFPDEDADGFITLADKADLDLKGFVRWLAVRKNLQILNDGQLDNKTNAITFYGQSRVRSDEMYALVQAVLRTNGLALVKSDVDEWYRVVELAQTRAFAEEKQPGELESTPKAEYVTAVFSLSHISPEEATSYLNSFLFSNEQISGTMTSIPGRQLLIVTETAKRLLRVRDLIKQIDQPVDGVRHVFRKVIHLSAEELVTQLQEILPQASSAGGNSTPQANQPSQNFGRQLRITANKRLDEIILIGTGKQIDEAMTLIDKLDVALGLEFQRYQFAHIPAARIDELIKQSLGTQDEQSISRIYQSSVRPESNELIVTARQEIHKRIEQFQKQLDIPSQEEESQSPVAFYTLKNVKAVDILDTLQSIERRFRESGSSRRTQRLDGIATREGFEVNGPNNFNPGFDGPITPTPFQQTDPRDGFSRANDLPRNFNSPFNGNQNGQFGGGFAQQASFSDSGSVIPGEAKITIDENTNTLIVVAEPAVQQLYASLIKRLDVRRPQVLIEVNVVTIADSDDFNLGIEIAGGDRDGGKRLFAFTSFGLSETDATAGTLSLNPALGFNGTLVDPDVADIVLRALSRHRKSKVIAAPRILVNDNATGLLSSVAEVPFTSVNAANTVSTTSFGGFAQAGTTISVSPQISEDDYLNLEFDVLVNDFTGAGGEGIPPPRNTDQVTSEVSIPDGHTIIVGGLTRNRISEDIQGIPLIEQLPIFRELTNRQIKSSEGQRLFVFIRPIILRDDKFKDLRFLSELERKRASLPDDFPKSSPVLVR
jgi:type II secretory pathway component GspD/PulD (secretin)